MMMLVLEMENLVVNDTIVKCSGLIPADNSGAADLTVLRTCRSG